MDEKLKELLSHSVLVANNNILGLQQTQGSVCELQAIAAALMRNGASETGMQIKNIALDIYEANMLVGMGSVQYQNIVRAMNDLIPPIPRK